MHANKESEREREKKKRNEEEEKETTDQISIIFCSSSSRSSLRIFIMKILPVYVVQEIFQVNHECCLMFVEKNFVQLL